MMKNLKRIKLFENFDRPINEGKVKELMAAIRDIPGNADMDPSQEWTPMQALEWAVGFAKEYGLWHPDDNASDIIWSKNKPSDLNKADKQMDRFCEVDWKSIGGDLDQYSVVMIVTDALYELDNDNQDHRMRYSPAEADALYSIFEAFKPTEKDLVQYRHKAEDLFFKYDKNQINLEGLISGLREIEDHARDHVGGSDDAAIWFRMTNDDTQATTIDDIENDLSLPASHPNHKLMREKIKGAYDLNNEIKIYFS